MRDQYNPKGALMAPLFFYARHAKERGVPVLQL